MPRLTGLIQATQEITSANRSKHVYSSELIPGMAPHDPNPPRGKKGSRKDKSQSDAAPAPRQLELYQHAVPGLNGSGSGAAYRLPTTPAAERAERERERQNEFTLALAQLRNLDELIDENTGEEDGENAVAMAEWLSLATYLVDSFRETRQLFPSDGKRVFTGMTRSWKRKGTKELDAAEEAARALDRMERQADEEERERAQAAEDQAQTGKQPGKPAEDKKEAADFMGLDFDGWLHLIVKYAFRLTQNDESEAAHETLTHVQLAQPFKSRPSHLLSLRLARIACYLHAGDPANVVVLARTIVLQHQFHSDAFRLLQTLVPTGQAAAEAYYYNPLLKFTIRQLRLIEDIAKGAPAVIGHTGQISLKSDKDDNDKDSTKKRQPVTRETHFLPAHSNPVYLAGYAGMLMGNRSWQSAIIYLLRALNAAPDQPVIHLALGVSYLSRAMSRKTDNREHQIAQAFGWLSQYRDLVGPGQEVEYNFGRAFQQLGLNHYAVKHYEQCLALAVTDRLAETTLSGEMDVDGARAEVREYDDYAKAAAYNLTTVYALLGRIELAKRVADRWLAV